LTVVFCDGEDAAISPGSGSEDELAFELFGLLEARSVPESVTEATAADSACSAGSGPTEAETSAGVAGALLFSGVVAAAGDGSESRTLLWADISELAASSVRLNPVGAEVGELAATTVLVGATGVGTVERVFIDSNSEGGAVSSEEATGVAVFTLSKSEGMTSGVATMLLEATTSGAAGVTAEVSGARTTVIGGADAGSDGIVGLTEFAATNVCIDAAAPPLATGRKSGAGLRGVMSAVVSSGASCARLASMDATNRHPANSRPGQAFE
jgi:hypothetical protein